MNRTLLSLETAELLKGLDLAYGRASFPRETFVLWRRRLRGVPLARRPKMQLELAAAARRIFKAGVEGATEAVAQLMVLANDLASAPRRGSWGPAR